jgi:hypothetical protein
VLIIAALILSLLTAILGVALGVFRDVRKRLPENRFGTKAAPSGQVQGEGWDKVWMPSNNSTGISSAARFNKFDGLVGFFGALFDTARNWGDTELMAMPGYRDRVVHVKLAGDEGGLNLSMPPEIIEALGERGELAGKLLADRFEAARRGLSRACA